MPPLGEIPYPSSVGIGDDCHTQHMEGVENRPDGMTASKPNRVIDITVISLVIVIIDME